MIKSMTMLLAIGVICSPSAWAGDPFREARGNSLSSASVESLKAEGTVVNPSIAASEGISVSADKIHTPRDEMRRHITFRDHTEHMILRQDKAEAIQNRKNVEHRMKVKGRHEYANSQNNDPDPAVRDRRESFGEKH